MPTSLQDLLEQAQRLCAAEPALRGGVEQVVAIAELDPDMAVTRTRKVLEYVVRNVYERDVKEPAGTRPLENLLQRLVKDGHLPRRLAPYANAVRELGNVGTHGFQEGLTTADVEQALRQVLPVLEWYGASSSPSSALDEKRPAPAPRAKPARPVPRVSCQMVIATSFCVVVCLSVLADWIIRSRGTKWLAQESEIPSLPALLDDLPSRAVLQEAYAGVPPETDQAAGPLRLQLALYARRSGEQEFQPIKDGDALSSKTDDYLIVARALTPGHLYLFQVDAVGKTEWLYPKNETSPSSSGTNPVQAHQLVQIPPAGAGEALFLDATEGVEHIYAVFSATRWQKLEAALAQAGAVDLPRPAAEKVIQTPLRLALRGVGGKRPIEGRDVAVTINQQKYQLVLPDEMLESAGSFLVVERWFRHVRLGK